jgi:hypothetical protein
LAYLERREVRREHVDRAMDRLRGRRRSRRLIESLHRLKVLRISGERRDLLVTDALFFERPQSMFGGRRALTELEIAQHGHVALEFRRE